MEDCPDCDGKGGVTSQIIVAGLLSKRWDRCSTCDGSGKKPRPSGYLADGGIW